MNRQEYLRKLQGVKKVNNSQKTNLDLSIEYDSICNFYNTKIYKSELQALEQIYLYANEKIGEAYRFGKIVIEDFSCIELSLEENNMNYLPDVISELVELKKLDLWRNKIKSLPLSMSNLENLVELNLSENDLVFIPEYLPFIKNLEKINLYNNHLTSLPKNFSELYNLANLDLSHNNFINTPEVLYEMPYLSKIDLRKNYFSQTTKEKLIAKMSNNRSFFI